MLNIVAVMVVRNEADILPINIRYHAAQGITEFRIVDNGSSDATSDRLRELARTIRIRWTRDEGRQQRLCAEGRLADEWRANSTEDGYLEIGPRRTPVIFDPRLRDAVRPWVTDLSGEWA